MEVYNEEGIQRIIEVYTEVRGKKILLLFQIVLRFEFLSLQLKPNCTLPFLIY